MQSRLGTMEAKNKRRTSSSSKSSSFSMKNTAQFFGDVKTECKKITWTNREELQVYAKIVVAATFFFGFSIFLVDLCVQGALDLLSSAFKVFFG